MEEKCSRHIVENGKSSGIDSGGLADEQFSEDEFSGDEFSDDESTDDVDSFGGCYTTSIAVDNVSEGASGKEAGKFISGNTRLKKLAIKGESMEWNADSNVLEWFQELCTGVARNRSIGHLSFRECGLTNEAATSTIAILSPFLELNANLCRLDIVGCNIRDTAASLLARTLSRRENKSSLKRIILDANNIGDNSGHDLVNALHGYENLEELSLGDDELGRRACIALSGFLSSPSTKLKELNIENNRIDNHGIACLADALANNTVLNELNLSFSCNVSQAGWQTFAPCLQNSNSALEVLDLSSTSITDEGAVALGYGLANNKMLKDLYCYDISAGGMPLITRTGWQSVFSCLRNKESALRYIDLRYSSIDEGGLSVLTNALSENSSLKLLDLSYNKQISSAGWRTFFTCLELPHAALEEVRLSENNVKDDDMAYLARSLHANNRKLVTLNLGDCPFITAVGWTALSNILCNTSSAATIHSSNHTLRSLGNPSVPCDLDDLLLLNSCGDEKSVSREKILRYHFKHDKTNMEEFVDMELTILHYAISWVGRNDNGRTLLYGLLRRLPLLVASANVQKVMGGKRKRVS